MDHYIGLLVAYAIVAATRYGVDHFFPGFIPVPRSEPVLRPGQELTWLLLTVVTILVVGQLYTAGLLIPQAVSWSGLTESINQILIFSPIFVFLLVMKPPLTSLFLSREFLLRRMLLGLLLAAMAIIVFTIATPADVTVAELLAPTINPDNLDFLVQVFFEDLLIAMFLARLSTLWSVRTTIIAVAAGFAAAHIPAFLAAGMAPFELLSLFADTAIGVLVLGTVLRTRDFIWIWPVHVLMDFTQLAF